MGIKEDTIESVKERFKVNQYFQIKFFNNEYSILRDFESGTYLILDKELDEESKMEVLCCSNNEKYIIDIDDIEYFNQVNGADYNFNTVYNLDYCFPQMKDSDKPNWLGFFSLEYGDENISWKGKNGWYRYDYYTREIVQLEEFTPKEGVHLEYENEFSKNSMFREYYWQRYSSLYNEWIDKKFGKYNEDHYKHYQTEEDTQKFEQALLNGKLKVLSLRLKDKNLWLDKIQVNKNNKFISSDETLKDVNEFLKEFPLPKGVYFLPLEV